MDPITSRAPSSSKTSHEERGLRKNTTPFAAAVPRRTSRSAMDHTGRSSSRMRRIDHTSAGPRPLPDYVAPGLRLLFVGINPGLVSAAAGHYYANPRNSFWRLLHGGGLTPVPLLPHDDARLPALGYGLTDIVKRPSRGARDLKRAEFVSGRRRLTRLVKRLKPRAVCFKRR